MAVASTTDSAASAATPTPATAAGPARPAAGATSDDSVSAAFAVAWHVAEMFHSTIPEHPEQPDLAASLPSMSNLTSYQFLQMGLLQLRGGVQKLGVEDGEIGAALARLQSDTTGIRIYPDQIRQDLLAMHTALLVQLTAKDFRLGKAYGLGRSLAETYLLPCTAASDQRASVLVEQFQVKQLGIVYRSLADLKSNLPPHSAYAVSRSVGIWQQLLTAPASSGKKDWTRNDATIPALRRQAQIWRALLTGEKTASDLLRAQDFIDAAGHLFGRMQALMNQYFRKSWHLLITWLVIVAVIMGGIALTAAVAGQLSALWASIVAAVLGVAGLWQSVSKAVGSVVGDVQKPLWQSELDESIALAATYLPKNAPLPARVPDVEVGELFQGDASVDLALGDADLAPANAAA